MNNKKQIFTVVVSVITTVFCVVIVAQAVTTIGNNVSIGGALDVFSTSTLATTTTTYLTSLGIAVTDLIDFNNIGFKTNIGYQAGHYDVSLYNTFVGYQAGMASSTASTNEAGYNTAVGYRSLYSNTTGYTNTANGVYALYSNTAGDYNTANGMQALFSNTTGYQNTANGMQALYYNTGYQNTANGTKAGVYIADGVTANTTSSNSVYEGYNAMAGADGNTNEIVIGASAIGNGSNSVTLGNTSITKTILKGNIGIGTTTPAYNLEVSSSASTTVMIGSGALTGCLGIGDTDKAGITWCTALDGTLTCTSVKPQQCK
ncbi:MAG: hypothetical protein Q7R99_01300 [bacterium]|nr:hypothetical protein [bacterium]